MNIFSLQDYDLFRSSTVLLMSLKDVREWHPPELAPAGRDVDADGVPVPPVDGHVGVCVLRGTEGHLAKGVHVQHVGLVVHVRVGQGLPAVVASLRVGRGGRESVFFFPHQKRRKRIPTCTYNLRWHCPCWGWPRRTDGSPRRRRRWRLQFPEGRERKNVSHSQTFDFGKINSGILFDSANFLLLLFFYTR